MYHSKLASEQTDALCEALVAVKTKEEAYRLLDDLCTISEVQAMGQRLAVARLLNKGATYQDIAGQTGASTATISRVNRCVSYGPDGYKIILKRLEREER